MKPNDEAACARYRELRAVLRAQLDKAPACDLLAALLLDSEGWGAWRSELKKLRKQRLATVRYLKQFLAIEPVLASRDREMIALVVSRLSKPTKQERMVKAGQAAAAARNNVVAALALRLATPKHKTRFWTAFIRALRVLYPQQFWSEVGAARMAATRGEKFLVKHGKRSTAAVMFGQERPSTPSLGYLPKLTIDAHVARITLLRDQLAR